MFIECSRVILKVDLRTVLVAHGVDTMHFQCVQYKQQQINIPLCVLLHGIFYFPHFHSITLIDMEFQRVGVVYHIFEFCRLFK